MPGASDTGITGLAATATAADPLWRIRCIVTTELVAAHPSGHRVGPINAGHGPVFTET